MSNFPIEIAPDFQGRSAPPDKRSLRVCIPGHTRVLAE